MLDNDAGAGWQPFHIVGADRGGRWLVTCDHAANTVPQAVVPSGSLGLPDADMQRHIAYDVGAAGVSIGIGARLGCPVLLSNFSRLLIDPNRGEDDPTLLMKLYDGSVIPANRRADAAELERRLDLCYRPYHVAYAELAARPKVVICAVHTFTPRLSGRPPRPWEVGILYSGDDRIARPLIGHLREAGLCVGDNRPYSGHLPGDSIDRHALSEERPHVLIEVRNDLVRAEAQQEAWAERLAAALEAALGDAHL